MPTLLGWQGFPKNLDWPPLVSSDSDHSQHLVGITTNDSTSLPSEASVVPLPSLESLASQTNHWVSYEHKSSLCSALFPVLCSLANCRWDSCLAFYLETKLIIAFRVHSQHKRIDFADRLLNSVNIHSQNVDLSSVLRKSLPMGIKTQTLGH